MRDDNPAGHLVSAAIQTAGTLLMEEPHNPRLIETFRVRTAALRLP